MTRDNDRPLITFALFAYNQEHFVREAIEGAFAQTYEPLEIILSDDCSSDGTYAVMEEMAKAYDGPHKITLNQNKENLGIGGHVNRMMELMSTDIIVVAAGDDISLPHRTEVTAEAFGKSKGNAVSIYSAVIQIDSQGKELGIASSPPPDENAELDFRVRRNCPGVHGASHAWRRCVFDVFGPLGANVIAEDRAIGFRAYELGEVLFLEAPLVKYRSHETNVCNSDIMAKDTNEYRLHCLDLARLDISIYNQYLLDLKNDIYSLNHGSRSVKSAVKTARQIATTKEQYHAFVSSSRSGQFRILIHSMLLGVSSRKLMTWLGRWCFPRSYERRVKAKLKKLVTGSQS